MQRALCPAALLAFLLFAPLALLSACSRESPCTPLAGANLRARVEARLRSERAALRESIGHYALAYDVGPQELHRFMAQIYPRREGPDIVMAGLGGIELHGGGVLEIIATLWWPNARPAELSDAFPFAWSKSPVPLREIYDSLRMQIFLPVPGIDTKQIDGQLPASPELPRTRIQHTLNGSPEDTELDAYNGLRLLIRYEGDLRALSALAILSTIRRSGCRPAGGEASEVLSRIESS